MFSTYSLADYLLGAFFGKASTDCLNYCLIRLIEFEHVTLSLCQPYKGVSDLFLMIYKGVGSSAW